MLAVAAALVAAPPAHAYYPNDGTTRCRASILVAYGWDLAPCMSIDGNGSIHMTVNYNVGSTDVRLYARILVVANGTALTFQDSAWHQSSVVGTNIAQGTAGSYDFGSVSEGAGDYVVETALTESGVWYGWVQSPVTTYGGPAAPPPPPPPSPSGPTAPYCKDPWTGNDYHYMYLDNRDSGYALSNPSDPTDTANLSVPGQAFYSAFTSGSGTFGVWSNPYPAIGLGLYPNESKLNFVHAIDGHYMDSVQQGKDALTAEIKSIVATCPTTNIYLGGYSQGAEVAGDVYQSLGGANIAGMVLFGDPRFNGKSLGDQGTDYDPNSNGVFADFDVQASLTAITGSPGPGIRGNYVAGNTKVMSFCNGGDPVCQGPSISNLLAAGMSMTHAGDTYAGKQYNGVTYPQLAANFFLTGRTRIPTPSGGVANQVTNFQINGTSATYVGMSGTLQLTSVTANTANVTYYLDVDTVGYTKPIATVGGYSHAYAFDTVAWKLIGTHSIAAVVRDSSGTTTGSSVLPERIQNTALNHFWINGQELDHQGVSGTIDLTATETLASWVMYYLDDSNPPNNGYAGAIPNWPAGGPLHTVTFDTTRVSNGTHTLTAVAFETFTGGSQVVSRPQLNVKTWNINVQNGVTATFKAPGFRIDGTACAYPASSAATCHFYNTGTLHLTAHEYLATWVEYYVNDPWPTTYSSPGELHDSITGGEPLGGDPAAGPNDHLLNVDVSQLGNGFSTITAATFGPNGNVVDRETLDISLGNPPGRRANAAMIQSGALAQYGQTVTGGPLIRNTSAPATPTGARDAATASSYTYVPTTSVGLTHVVESDGLLHQLGQQTDGSWTDTTVVNGSGQSVAATAVSSIYDTGTNAVVADVIGAGGSLSQLVQQPDGTWKQSTVTTANGTPILATAVSLAYEPDKDVVLAQAVESDGLLHQLTPQPDGTWTDTAVTAGSATVPAKSVSSAYETTKATLVNQVIESDGQLHQVVQKSDGTWSDTSQSIAAKSVESAYKDSDGSLTSEVVEPDGLLHQVVQKSDGTTNDAVAVTDAGTHINVAPVAVAGAKPTPGVAFGITVDASGSSSSGAAITGYTFDFGDGTVVGPQASPKAAHVYATAGAFTAKVTVTDAIGLSTVATATANPSATATPAAAYVKRVAADAAKVTNTSVTLPASAATKDGNALVVTALLTSTSSLTGTVAATDTQGNTYTVVNDTNDGASNDRLLTLAAFGTKALGTSDMITLTFPSTQEHHIAVDEYTGIKAADQSANMSGVAEVTFNTGPTKPTSSDGELVIGVVGTEGGDPPQLTADYTALGLQQVANDSLLSGYQSGVNAGAYRAGGVVSGPWLAQVTTFVPTGPPVLTAKVSATSSTDPMTFAIDSSGTTAGSNPVATYTFDFGDGSTAGPQAGATVSHTYAKPGSYTVTVTVKDTAGSASSATTAISAAASAPPAPIAYVGRVGGDARQAASGSVTITPSAATHAGDALIVTALLTNSPSGTVSATDTQGDTFAVVNDTNDGAAKDRLVTLAAFGAKSLGTGDSVTLSFPSATEHHVTVDEYSGVGAVDQHVGANGPAGSTFSSGSTAQATSSNELVIGVVGTEGGAAPTITGSGSYTALPLQQVSNDSLLSGYRTSSSGTAGTTGTQTGAWMAQTTTFRGVGPARLTGALSAAVSTTSPMSVTADASASTAGASPIATYAFDFGDGTAASTQATATASHTYKSAGTYTVKVSVTDGTGSVVTATTTVTVAPTPPIAYMGRVTSDAVAATSTSLALHPAASVRPGDTLAVSVMLTNVKSGSVTVTDNRGNAYALVSDTADGAGDRTLIFVARNTAAMNAADTITLTYPSNTEHHVAVDEFSGVTAIDQKAAATGSASTFDSGATPTTTAASELVLAVAGIQGGDPTVWGSGYTALPTLLVSQDQLAIAYRIVSATGSFHATGTAQKTWMAGVVTLS